MQPKLQFMLCWHADLVFIQNGMLQPWLDARGLGNNTQVQQSHQQFVCMHTPPVSCDHSRCCTALYCNCLREAVTVGTGLLCRCQER